MKKNPTKTVLNAQKADALMRLKVAAQKLVTLIEKHEKTGNSFIVGDIQSAFESIETYKSKHWQLCNIQPTIEEEFQNHIEIVENAKKETPELYKEMSDLYYKTAISSQAFLRQYGNSELAKAIVALR